MCCNSRVKLKKRWLHIIFDTNLRFDVNLWPPAVLRTVRSMTGKHFLYRMRKLIRSRACNEKTWLAGIKNEILIFLRPKPSYQGTYQRKERFMHRKCSLEASTWRPHSFHFNQSLIHATQWESKKTRSQPSTLGLIATSLHILAPLTMGYVRFLVLVISEPVVKQWKRCIEDNGSSAKSF